MEKKSEYTFTEPQLAHILALQQQGASLSEIAEEYQVSGQVICEEIKRARLSMRFQVVQGVYIS